MTASQRIATLLVLALGLAAPVARAQSNPDAVQLADLVVEALPAGEMFQTFLDGNPEWPLNGKASRVSAADLQCLRSRLSARGFREQRGEEATAFVQRHRDKVEPSLKVLREGGAAVFGASIRAGLDEQKTGQKQNYSEVASRFTPGQFAAFIELTSDDKHRALRQLIGIEDALDIQSSAEENRSRGKNKGMMIGMKLVLSAMDHCKVPLAAVM